MILVIGVGNPFHGDDGAGPAVLARLRERARSLPGVLLVDSDGDPAGLLDVWPGAELAVLVDAVRTNPSRPGRTHRLVLGRHPAPASSHGFDLGTAIGLARALGRLPGKLVIFAVEIGTADPGPGLSPEVAAAIDGVADRVIAEINHHRSITVQGH